MHINLQSFALLIILINLSCVLSENKYLKSANEKNKEEVDFRKLEKPFRMNKLNLLWIKAQQRLTEPKLKSLYSDLKIQDKEELIHKKVKMEGGDKEGYKEAELRKKLTDIMVVYNLREHFHDNVVPSKFKENKNHNEVDKHINKSLFKDKKLNRLWEKAEVSGFTSEELSALKEEFQHHQDKIDQYYDLLNSMETDPKDGYKNALEDEELVKFNEITPLETEGDFSKDYLHKSNLVRDKHRQLRDGYDRLDRIAARGPNNKEFIEPKVQGLWRMAAAGNFTIDELASLKVELLHYESRLLKLRHLNAEQANAEQLNSKIAGLKSDEMDNQMQLIKKHSLKVAKMHADLESRILERHGEL